MSWAAAGTAVEVRGDAAVERVRAEEVCVHAAGEGEGLAFQVREVFGDRAGAVRGERDDALSAFEALASELHVSLAPAGDVLEATAVDDARVRDAGAGEGSA